VEIIGGNNEKQSHVWKNIIVSFNVRKVLSHPEKRKAKSFSWRD